MLPSPRCCATADFIKYFCCPTHSSLSVARREQDVKRYTEQKLSEMKNEYI